MALAVLGIGLAVQEVVALVEEAHDDVGGRFERAGFFSIMSDDGGVEPNPNLTQEAQAWT
jgi:hypothetical protein